MKEFKRMVDELCRLLLRETESSICIVKYPIEYGVIHPQKFIIIIILKSRRVSFLINCPDH